MIQLVLNADSSVAQWSQGEGSFPKHVGQTLVMVPDSVADQITAAWSVPGTVGIMWDGTQITAIAGTIPTPPPAPDIAGLIRALTASPSIDQATKNALIASLQGQ